MGFFIIIRQLFFGYTVESRSNHTIKIMGITFEHANVRLFRKKGVHEVLLLSVWDQPITLCVLLTSDLRQNIQKFFKNSSHQAESQLLMPIHHQIINLKFHVFNSANKKRKVVITQGIQKTYYTLTDEEIDLANTFFQGHV